MYFTRCSRELTNINLKNKVSCHLVELRISALRGPVRYTPARSTQVHVLGLMTLSMHYQLANRLHASTCICEIYACSQMFW